VVVVPDGSGRILGISVPRIPWHDIPVTPQEDEAFDVLPIVIHQQYFRPSELHLPPVTDDSVHQALCVEEGCARCVA
jgi:hypothetical protein